ncbi:MAG: phosphate ABC transporter substrate-binding protein PstS, partial [Methylocella sp.]
MTDCLNKVRPARVSRLTAALAFGLLALPAAAAPADGVTLAETGSTLFYPLFNVWASEYMKTHPGVNISTASTGSGAGIDQAVSGEVQIGTSDSFMSDVDIRRHPQIINVPMAISAQLVVYNIPGINTANVKLDGPALAGIYTGKIRTWDDKAIAALNPGLTLPHNTIVPIRRGEESGDTFIFTQYLTFSTEAWENSHGFGNKIAWPAVPGELEAIGNAGMVEKIQQTPYSIGYVGISFFADIAKASLGTAALKSYSGEFLLPTPESIEASAASLGPRTPPDQRLTLVNAPGANAYPLVNYEYAIVSTNQPNPAMAAAMRKFLLWAIAPDETNDKYIKDEHFIPLPAHIWVLSHDQIMKIANPPAITATPTAPVVPPPIDAAPAPPAAEVPAPPVAAVPAKEAPTAPVAEAPVLPPAVDAPAAPAVAPAPANPLKIPASKPVAPAVAVAPGTAIFPSAISAAYANEKPYKARLKTCSDQFKAN